MTTQIDGTATSTPDEAQLADLNTATNRLANEPAWWSSANGYVAAAEDLRRQGYADGWEWARDYADIAELTKISRRVHLRGQAEAIASNHFKESDRFITDDERAELVKNFDEDYTATRTEHNEAPGLDSVSHTLLAFLRERRNRPVMVPDALVISLDGENVSPYWDAFEESAAGLWEVVSDSVTRQREETERERRNAAL